MNPIISVGKNMAIRVSDIKRIKLIPSACDVMTATIVVWFTDGSILTTETMSVGHAREWYTSVLSLWNKYLTT